jgi:hypothetical protein
MDDRVFKPFDFIINQGFKKLLITGEDFSQVDQQDYQRLGR